jgi:hypothetical protein
MTKTVEHIHWPDAPDMWMPYAPAIKVTGGSTIYLAGVTAAPVYHHHPHRPEEFDSMPSGMEGQARAALENLKRGLVPRHSDYDWWISSQSKMGMSCGATRISMLRATPG